MSDEELLKFDKLKEEYSDEYVELLKQISKECDRSFDYIYSKLPCSQLVSEDEEFSKQFGRVVLGIASPQSHVLTLYYAGLGKIPSDYPEQPRYFISKSEGYVSAKFTKTEFLESVKKEQEKKLIRK